MPIRKVAVATTVLALGLTLLPTSPASTADTWASPTALTGPSVTADSVVVLSSSNGANVLTLWREASGITHVVKSRRSADGGVSWSSEIQVSPAGEDVEEFSATLSADGQRAVMVWGRDTGVGRGLAVASSDGGTTWGSATALNLAGNDATELDLHASDDGSVVHAVWRQGNEIHANVSQDYGVTWRGNSLLSPFGSNTDKPRIAGSADGSRAIVSWVNYTATPDSIQVARTANAGLNWTEPGAGDRISSNGAPGYDRSYIASSNDGMTVAVIWENQAGGATDTFFNRSTDGGATWLSAPDIQQLSASALPRDVSLSGNGETMAVMISGPDVRVSTNSGQTWGAAQSISPAGSASFGVDVTVSDDGSSVLALWRNSSNSSAQVGRYSASSGWTLVGTLSANTNNLVSTAMSSSADLSWSTVAFVQGSGTGDQLWASRSGFQPTLTAVSPDRGAATGGSTVTINGSGFVTGATATIAGVPLTNIAVTSSTTLTGITGAMPAGLAIIEVTNVDGGKATLSNAFTATIPQVAKPTVTFAKKLKPKKWVKIVKKPVTTNAGQTASFQVTAKAGNKAVSNKNIIKTRTKKKHLWIWVSGTKKMTVTVALSAPIIGKYDAFSLSKVYRVKKAKKNK